MKNNNAAGIFFTVFGAVLWSLNAPLVKSINLDPILLAALRGLIGGLVMLPFVRIKGISWNINTVCLLICFTVQCTFIVVALKLTSAPIATGMQFTAPVWLYLLERKKGDPFRFSRLWPLFILLAGIILFMCSKAEGVTMLGNLVALATSFTFAGVTYFTKKVVKDCPVGTASICCLFLALVLFTFFIDEPVKTLLSIPRSTWPLVLFLGIVQYGGGYAFYNMGVKRISGQTAAMLAPVEMVLGPVWVAIFMHEYTDAIGLIAFVIVLVGIVSEVIVSGRHEHGTQYPPHIPHKFHLPHFHKN